MTEIEKLLAIISTGFTIEDKIGGRREIYAKRKRKRKGRARREGVTTLFSSSPERAAVCRISESNHLLYLRSGTGVTRKTFPAACLVAQNAIAST